ncbi:MAG: tautomerase family protein [bacterium]|nr:tautomerase family protein [bacterium]
MIKIYGIEEILEPKIPSMSDVIQGCMQDALGYPANKRAQRFLPVKRGHFFSPEGRTEAYTILEISLLSGRSKEAKKTLIYLLFERFERELGIKPVDLEITLFDSPGENWGFRGITGDEAQLDYKINV